MFLSHEQIAIMALSCVMGVFYIAAMSDESIFKTDNSYGRVSHGLFKTCLLSDSQGYVPTGCYDYGSDYGKILSNDCQIFDGGGNEIDFCNKRKAGASFVAMSFIALVASVVLSALAVMELPFSSTVHIVSTVMQLICFLFVMIGFSILASIKTAYDAAQTQLTFDLDYGPTFVLLVIAWILHFVSLILHLLVDPSEGGPVVPVGQMRMLSTDPNPFAKPVTGDPFNASGQDSPFDDDDDEVGGFPLSFPSISIPATQRIGSVASLGASSDINKGSSVIPSRNEGSAGVVERRTSIIPDREQGSTASSGFGETARRSSIGIMPGAATGLPPLSEEDPFAGLDPLAGLLGGSGPSNLQVTDAGTNSSAAGAAGKETAQRMAMTVTPPPKGGVAGNDDADDNAAFPVVRAGGDSVQPTSALALPNTPHFKRDTMLDHMDHAPKQTVSMVFKTEGQVTKRTELATEQRRHEQHHTTSAKLTERLIKKTQSELEETASKPPSAPEAPKPKPTANLGGADAPGYVVLAEVMKQNPVDNDATKSEKVPESDASSKEPAPQNLDVTLVEGEVDSFGMPKLAADDVEDGPVLQEVHL